MRCNKCKLYFGRGEFISKDFILVHNKRNRGAEIHLKTCSLCNADLVQNAFLMVDEIELYRSMMGLRLHSIKKNKLPKKLIIKDKTHRNLY